MLPAETPPTSLSPILKGSTSTSLTVAVKTISRGSQPLVADGEKSGSGFG